ncbi:mite group 2 allergen Tyr p 2-like [Limulus polyphemus]|uniref:Mite group 2 allergen Tyr p 2-like n=1 Tax=Limulus polyphemus TaxID=6850 RepID=A0ABM1SQD9_LIMPO|nr:mite group 2 allergen Tyr p 2-like [Limulus polyphemus]
MYMFANKSMEASIVITLIFISSVRCQCGEDTFHLKQFENCGGETSDIRVRPCKSEPCSFTKGQLISLEVDFNSGKCFVITMYHKALQQENDLCKQGEQNSNFIDVNVMARFMEMDFPLPGINQNGCKGYGLTCPIKNGQNYTLRYSMMVDPFFPTIETNVTWRLTGEGGKLLCLKTPMQITDPPVVMGIPFLPFL